MTSLPTWFATVTLSEERISHLEPWLAFGALLVAAALVLTSLILRVTIGRTSNWGWRTALMAGAVALYPFALFWCIYELDHVAAGVDGTKSSGPLWTALAAPGVPVIAAVFLTLSYIRFPKQ
jgi:hypothetical protein